jgi:SAM-dependent methyltransferase
MKAVSHADQQKIWEEEYKNPYVLLPMDSHEASSGVSLFWDSLKEKGNAEKLRGIEMGCGKGRNSIWLAKQGVDMIAFDFSSTAIDEAQKRAAVAGVENNARFVFQDATKTWPFESNSFDFAIDCFASTDIESTDGRSFARDEFLRILKPGGYLFVYTLSTDDEFHKEMLEKSPAQEKNAFLHPTIGKFEKVFDREELMEFYKGWKVVEEKRVAKVAKFFGKDYNCKHFWVVFQK